MPLSSITCIGAGYVGGPTMAVIADRCPHIKVTVVDSNSDRIAAWNSDNLPVFEPGLDGVVRRVRGRNLFFSSDIEQAITSADCIFISVNTPTKTEGEGAGKASDLRFVEACTREIARHARNGVLVVEKSTMPVRSAETIKSVLASVGGGKSFDVLSNPEFLAEGTAIADLENPDRVLIGGDPQPAALLADVYASWVPREKILTTNVWSAEMAKLAANAFLAQRVSSINALSAFCEATGADIDEVARAIGTDSRIGSKFLKAGAGFGGSCFKKDILNLVYLCEHHGLPEVAAYWQQVVEINEWQKRRVAATVLRNLGGSVQGKRLAILGFAFKKDTNDTREAPAINVCAELLRAGARLVVYDPKVTRDQMLKDLSPLAPTDNLSRAASVQEACQGAASALILTDWDEFRHLAWPSLAAALLPSSWVFDARNCADHASIRAANLRLWAVGKPNID
jgi:UDPglucose 6-dehydrogenase